MIRVFCAIDKNHKEYSTLYRENFEMRNINKHVFSARRRPDKVHYRIVRCNKCGLVYSNPILPYGKIKKLYKKSLFTYSQQTSNIIETYYTYLKKALPFLKSRESFLEIGCGNGFLLKKVKDHGFKEVYGIEPSKDAVQKSDKKIRINIINDIFKPGIFQKNKFDMIAFFQVFDHVFDPNQFLKECHRILKPGGIALAINHDVDSFMPRLFREKCPIFDIEHIYLFNKKTMQLIFKKHGFKVLEVFGVKNTFALNYALSFLPVPILLKKPIMNLAKHLGISAMKIRLKPGNLGIIAKK